MNNRSAYGRICSEIIERKVETVCAVPGDQ
jgi:hypothetical protein